MDEPAHNQAAIDVLRRMREEGDSEEQRETLEVLKKALGEESPTETRGTRNMSTQFVTDPAGNRTAVILDMDTYRQLLDAQEELEDLRAYDEAKAAGNEAIPFDQALAEIEAERAQRRAG